MSADEISRVELSQLTNDHVCWSRPPNLIDCEDKEDKEEGIG